MEADAVTSFSLLGQPTSAVSQPVRTFPTPQMGLGQTLSRPRNRGEKRTDGWVGGRMDGCTVVCFSDISLTWQEV